MYMYIYIIKSTFALGVLGERHPLRSVPIRLVRELQRDPKNLRVSGFGSRVYDFGFRVCDFGFRVDGSGCRVYGVGFRVYDFGSRVYGFGFRVYGPRCGQKPETGFWSTNRSCGTGARLPEFSPHKGIQPEIRV